MLEYCSDTKCEFIDCHFFFLFWTTCQSVFLHNATLNKNCESCSYTCPYSLPVGGGNAPKRCLPTVIKQEEDEEGEEIEAAAEEEEEQT